MSEQEGSPWFWKIFGGAILGMLTLLGVTLMNVINNANHQSKTDLNGAIQEIRSDIKVMNNDLAQQKAKLSNIENASYKEEIDSIRKKIEDVEQGVVSRNEKIAAIESTLISLKEKVGEEASANKQLYEKIVQLENDIKILKEQSKEMQQDVEAKKTSLLEK